MLIFDLLAGTTVISTGIALVNLTDSAERSRRKIECDRQNKLLLEQTAIGEAPKQVYSCDVEDNQPHLSTVGYGISVSTILAGAAYVVTRVVLASL